MVSFHPETIENFKGNLPWLEKVRDECAEEVERARNRVVDREQRLVEAEAMLADQRRLIEHMEATNAEAAELAEARAQVEQAAADAPVAPDFKAGDLVNISDPAHKRWGTRGSVVGYVYDPLGVVVEYDNLGNTLTVRPDQLMHHTEFVKQSDEHFDAAEAADVRRIEHDAAIDAGDDHDPETCPECEA